MSQQSDFLTPILNEHGDFIQYLLWRTTAFPAAYIRNNAIAAIIITAIHDGYPGAYSRVADLAHRFSQSIGSTISRNNQTFLPLFFQQNFCQTIDILCSQYDINVRRPTKNGSLIFQRQATCNDKHPFWVLFLKFLYGANMAKNPVFRAFTHAAGIHHYYICLYRRINRYESETFELSRNTFRIAQVHLAAETFNVISIQFHNRSFP